ncbi:hypothetical protein ACOMCU_16315 [Lysinibacillus sp. UGB7]|uniref:hypothetical protein n=1 Tax=Lysinibacillus sp. UGB7 TaxID=3411039 RepID=UPI003B824F2D
MANLKKYKEIIQDFSNNNIDTTQVGFYDTPEFISIENNNPSYLQNYAKFVQLQRYDETYLNMVREKVPFIAEILYKELEKDGRLGACIDVSMTLSRILEKEGIWNHMVCGSLNIDYPKKSKLPRGHFWSCDISYTNQPIMAAHAWLFVPPFYVVDLTVKMQQYTLEQVKYLPNFVVSEKTKQYVPKAEDLINTIVVRDYKQRGFNDILSKLIPNFKSFNSIFPAVSTKYSETTLHYIPTSISAPDAPFEQAINLKLNGKYGNEIYKEIIQPALKENGF